MGTRIKVEIGQSPIVGGVKVERATSASEKAKEAQFTPSYEHKKPTSRTMDLRPEQRVNALESSVLLNPRMRVNSNEPPTSSARQPLLVKDSDTSDLPRKNQRAISAYEQTENVDKRQAIETLFSIDIHV